MPGARGATRPHLRPPGDQVAQVAELPPARRYRAGIVPVVVVCPGGAADRLWTDRLLSGCAVSAPSKSTCDHLNMNCRQCGPVAVNTHQVGAWDRSSPCWGEGSTAYRRRRPAFARRSEKHWACSVDSTPMCIVIWHGTALVMGRVPNARLFTLTEGSSECRIYCL